MRTRRPSATRSALTLLVATLLLAGCNGLIDQQATYTTSATQSITGTAATRNGDPLTGVTVNGVGATLNDQKYTAVLALDGTAVFNRVLVVASYQSGFTSTERATVAYADGTHATVVAPASAVTGGGGVRLTAAGFAKLLPDASSALVLHTAFLDFPSTSFCSGTCTVSQAAPPTIGDPTHHVSLALTNPSALSVQATLPLVEEYLSFKSSTTTCSFNVIYSQIEAYDSYQIASDPTEAGGLRVRVNGSPGPVLLFSKSAIGCATLPSSVMTPILNAADTLVTNGAQTVLNEPTPVGGPPVSGRTNLSDALEGVLTQLNPASGTLFDGVTDTSPLSSALTDGDGAFLGADPHDVASAVATGAPAQADSLGFGASTASAPGSTGAFGLGFDLAGGASFTSLNQALAAATERGALNQTVVAHNGTPLTYNGLNTLVGLGGALATDRPVQLVVAPELAPAVTTATNQSEGGFARIHIGGLRVTAQFADTKGTFLSFVVDLDTDPYLNVSDGSAVLSVTDPQPAATHVDELVRLAPIPAGAGAATFSQLRGDLLGPLTNGGIPVFPLPTIAGHTLSEVSSGRVGDSAYLFLTIN